MVRSTVTVLKYRFRKEEGDYSIYHTKVTRQILWLRDIAQFQIATKQLSTPPAHVAKATSLLQNDQNSM